MVSLGSSSPPPQLQLMPVTLRGGKYIAGKSDFGRQPLQIAQPPHGGIVSAPHGHIKRNASQESKIILRLNSSKLWLSRRTRQVSACETPKLMDVHSKAFIVLTFYQLSAPKGLSDPSTGGRLRTLRKPEKSVTHRCELLLNKVTGAWVPGCSARRTVLPIHSSNGRNPQIQAISCSSSAAGEASATERHATEFVPAGSAVV